MYLSYQNVFLYYYELKKGIVRLLGIVFVSTMLQRDQRTVEIFKSSKCYVHW